MVISPPQEPEFVLYGTLLAGDLKVAYMEDTKSPYTSKGRGKRQRAIHIGEELSGYVLGEIYNDRVVMIKGNERVEVMVAESSKYKHQKITIPFKPKKIKELKKQKAVKRKKGPPRSRLRQEKRKK